MCPYPPWELNPIASSGLEVEGPFRAWDGDGRRGDLESDRQGIQNLLQVLPSM